MNRIVYWSLTVAVAGFLFGFDVAVISGADQPIQKLWGTSPLVHGLFVMSSALWGTVIGALFANYPCERFGRKPTLQFIAVLYLLSAVGSAIAQDPYTFALLRFIGGLGVGISSIVVPAYISEIAPANMRGRLVALYQFQIVFGILIAYLSNYLLSGVIAEDWRLMLGAEAIPALAYLIMIWPAPESPRWLIVKKHDETAARAVFDEIAEPDADKVIEEIRHDAEHPMATGRLFTSVMRWPIFLAFMLAFFNQLSGINFIIYYAPRVFELAGLSTSSSLLSSTGIGVVNLLFTMLGLYLIDHLGRRSLLLIGSVGYIVSLAAVAWAFANGIGGMVVVTFVFIFIAAHAVGQGAIIWVFIAEIFPNHVRAKGQSFGCGTHWVLAALIALAMPIVLESFSAATVFSFFAGMMVLQLMFALFLFPETKGKTLEELFGSLNREATMK